MCSYSRNSFESSALLRRLLIMGSKKEGDESSNKSIVETSEKCLSENCANKHDSRPGCT